MTIDIKAFAVHHHVWLWQAADCALKLHGAQNELRQAAEKLALMDKQESDASAEHASTQHILQVSSPFKWYMLCLHRMLFHSMFCSRLLDLKQTQETEIGRPGCRVWPFSLLSPTATFYSVKMFHVLFLSILIYDVWSFAASSQLVARLCRPFATTTTTCRKVSSHLLSGLMCHHVWVCFAGTHKREWARCVLK